MRPESSVRFLPYEAPQARDTPFPCFGQAVQKGTGGSGAKLSGMGGLHSADAGGGGLICQDTPRKRYATGQIALVENSLWRLAAGNIGMPESQDRNSGLARTPCAARTTCETGQMQHQAGLPDKPVEFCTRQDRMHLDLTSGHMPGKGRIASAQIIGFGCPDKMPYALRMHIKQAQKTGQIALPQFLKPRAQPLANQSRYDLRGAARWARGRHARQRSIGHPCRIGLHPDSHMTRLTFDPVRPARDDKITAGIDLITGLKEEEGHRHMVKETMTHCAAFIGHRPSMPPTKQDDIGLEGQNGLAGPCDRGQTVICKQMQPKAGAQPGTHHALRQLHDFRAIVVQSGRRRLPGSPPFIGDDEINLQPFSGFEQIGANGQNHLAMHVIACCLENIDTEHQTAQPVVIRGLPCAFSGKQGRDMRAQARQQHPVGLEQVRAVQILQHLFEQLRPLHRVRLAGGMVQQGTAPGDMDQFRHWPGLPLCDHRIPRRDGPNRLATQRPGAQTVPEQPDTRSGHQKTPDQQQPVLAL